MLVQVDATVTLSNIGLRPLVAGGRVLFRLLAAQDSYAIGTYAHLSDIASGGSIDVTVRWNTAVNTSMGGVVEVYYIGKEGTVADAKLRADPCKLTLGGAVITDAPAGGIDSTECTCNYILFVAIIDSTHTNAKCSTHFVLECACMSIILRLDIIFRSHTHPIRQGKTRYAHQRSSSVNSRSSISAAFTVYGPAAGQVRISAWTRLEDSTLVQIGSLQHTMKPQSRQLIYIPITHEGAFLDDLIIRAEGVTARIALHTTAYDERYDFSLSMEQITVRPGAVRQLADGVMQGTFLVSLPVSNTGTIGATVGVAAYLVDADGNRIQLAVVSLLLFLFICVSVNGMCVCFLGCRRSVWRTWALLA